MTSCRCRQLRALAEGTTNRNVFYVLDSFLSFYLEIFGPTARISLRRQTFSTRIPSFTRLNSVRHVLPRHAPYF